MVSEAVRTSDLYSIRANTQQNGYRLSPNTTSPVFLQTYDKFRLINSMKLSSIFFLASIYNISDTNPNNPIFVSYGSITINEKPIFLFPENVRRKNKNTSSVSSLHQKQNFIERSTGDLAVTPSHSRDKWGK